MSTGLAQQGRGSDSPAEEFAARLEREEARGGAYAASLMEPLLDLGQHYFQQGRLEQALETLQRARHVTRVNQGLYSFQEVLVLRQLVGVHEARGEFAEAWELEKLQVDLAKRHISEAGSLPIFRDLANKRLELLERFRSGRFAPQIVLGCYYGMRAFIDRLLVADATINVIPRSSSRCDYGSRRIVELSLLIEARAYQAMGIESLLRNGGYASEELQDTVKDFLGVSEDIQERLPQYSDPLIGLVMGQVLRQPVSQREESIAQARLLLQVADFNVRRSHRAGHFQQHDLVVRQYEQAYGQLLDAGVELSAINAMFSPGLPVVLPAFEPNPLAPREGAEPSAYIDLDFGINKYGRSQAIRVRGASDTASPSHEEDLIRLIRQSIFRPAISDGRVAENSDFSIRFYFYH